MSILKYVVFGKETMSVNFACEDDAVLIADELVNLPGVVYISVDNKPVFKKARYELWYLADCSECGADRRYEHFDFIGDAARFADKHAMFGYYTIVDLFEDKTYGPDDVECLL